MVEDITKNIKNLFHIIHGGIAFDQCSHSLVRTPNSFWNPVNILGFHNGFEIVFEYFGKVILKKMIST